MTVQPQGEAERISPPAPLPWDSALRLHDGKTAHRLQENHPRRPRLPRLPAADGATSSFRTEGCRQAGPPA